MSKIIEHGQKLGRLLGFAASVAAVAVFFYLFFEVLTDSDIRGLAGRHWNAILIATLIYCVAYVPMTVAWIRLAQACGANAPHLALACVLLISQIGKYLPGNFAQFLGRAYLARRVGVPVAASGLAIILELAGILAASGVLAAAAMALEPAGTRPETAQAATWISGITGLAALLASIWLLSSKGGRSRAFVKPLLWAICLYVLVLSLLAVANIVLVTEIGGDWSLAIAGQVAGAFIVSWLVGFATPGSPAGLGLRELTFVVLLTGNFRPETLILAAGAFRLVTVAGDLVAWLTGLLLLRERGTRESRSRSLFKAARSTRSTDRRALP